MPRSDVLDLLLGAVVVIVVAVLTTLGIQFLLKTDPEPPTSQHFRSRYDFQHELSCSQATRMFLADRPDYLVKACGTRDRPSPGAGDRTVELLRNP